MRSTAMLNWRAGLPRRDADEIQAEVGAATIARTRAITDGVRMLKRSGASDDELLDYLTIAYERLCDITEAALLDRAAAARTAAVAKAVIRQ